MSLFRTQTEFGLHALQAAAEDARALLPRPLLLLASNNSSARTSMDAHPGTRGGEEARPAVLQQSAVAGDQSRVDQTLAEPQQSAAALVAGVELDDPAAEFYGLEYSDDDGDGDGEDGDADGDGGSDGGTAAEAAALRRLEPWRVAVRGALGGDDGSEPALPCHILPHLLLGDMVSRSLPALAE